MTSHGHQALARSLSCMGWLIQVQLRPGNDGQEHPALDGTNATAQRLLRETSVSDGVGAHRVEPQDSLYQSTLNFRHYLRAYARLQTTWLGVYEIRRGCVVTRG